MDQLHGEVLRAFKGLSLPADQANFTGAVRQHAVTGGDTEHHIVAVWFPAGARTILHHHPVDQLLVCFEGEIAVAIGKERRLLVAGEMLVVPKDVWHWHGATPHADGAHFSIKPHGPTTWGGAPAEEQLEFDAYVDWAGWARTARR